MALEAMWSSPWEGLSNWYSLTRRIKSALRAATLPVALQHSTDQWQGKVQWARGEQRRMEQTTRVSKDKGCICFGACKQQGGIESSRWRNREHDAWVLRHFREFYPIESYGRILWPNPDLSGSHRSSCSKMAPAASFGSHGSHQGLLCPLSPRKATDPAMKLLKSLLISLLAEIWAVPCQAAQPNTGVEWKPTAGPTPGAGMLLPSLHPVTFPTFLPPQPQFQCC